MCQVTTGNRALYELLHMPSQSNTSLTAPVGQLPTHFKIHIDGIEPPPNELPLQVSAATGVEIRDTEEDIVFDNGTVVHLLGNVVPLFDEKDRPRGAVSAFVDITERVQAEETLRESEARAQAMFRANPDLMFRMNRQGVFLDCKADISDLYAQSEPTIVGKRNRDIAPSEFADLIDLRISTTLETGMLQTFEYELPIPGRGVRNYEARMVPSGADEVTTIVRDITERVQVEKELENVKTTLEAAFEQTPIPMVLVSMPDTVVRITNSACREILGVMDEPTPVGQQLVDFKPSYQDYDAQGNLTLLTEAPLALALQGKKTLNQERRFVTKDGTTRWALVSANPIYNANGNLIAAYLVFPDITKRKRAEEALRESETKYQLVFENSGTANTIFDIECRVILQNSLSKNLSQPGDALGKKALVIFGPEQGPIVTERMRRVLTSGVSEIFETEFNMPMGRRWIHSSYLPIRNEQHIIVGIQVISQDITERKQAEELLRENEARYRNIFEGVKDAIFVETPSGKILDVNQHACEMFGYSRTQFLTKTVADLVPSKENIVLLNLKDSPSLPNHPVETINVRENGEQFPIEISISLQKQKGESVLFVVGRDITERKRAEETLRFLSTRQEAILAAVPDIIMEVDNNKVYTWANRAGMEFFGKGVIGKKAAFYFLGEQATYDRVRPLFNGSEDVIYVESWQRRRDGERRLLAWWCRVLKDSKGNVTGVLSTAHDITERKRAEDEILEKSKELEALFTISSHLRTAQTVDDMFPVVLTQMSKVLNAKVNAVVLLDPDQTHFTFAAGNCPPGPKAGRQIDVENSLSGYVLKTRQPYVTPDFANEPLRSPEIPNSEKIGPMVVVPLQSESEFIGTLVCARTKDTRMISFTPAEVELLVSIGEMVGNALRRAHLYNDALSRLQRVQGLRSIDSFINANMDTKITLKLIVNQALSLMNVDAAAILLNNPILHSLEYATAQGFHYKDIEKIRFELENDFSERVLLERRIITASDLSSKQGTIHKEIMQKEGFVACNITPMIAKGRVLGVLELCNRTPLYPNQEWLDFLEALGAQAAIAIDNALLFRDLQTSNLELALAYDATIQGWSQALELKDRETEGHTLRVTEATIGIAKLAGLSENEIMHIRRGALLHDIGKMGIPDNILKKAGKLTPKEWDIMRQHPQNAYDMLHPIEFLRPALDIPYYHHEKWDGTGYPQGLHNLQIPFAARLFAVVDVWDALTSNRIYRKAWPKKKAFAHIQEQSGKYFDPQVVGLFMKFANTMTLRKK